MFKPLREPEVAEEEAKYVPHKFDFSDFFDRTVFEGRVQRKVRYANGTIKKIMIGILFQNKWYRILAVSIIYFFVSTTSLPCLNPKILLRNYFRTRKKYSTKNKECMNIKQLKWYSDGVIVVIFVLIFIDNFYSCFQRTNLKATLVGDSPNGNIYTYYHPLSNKELYQYSGIYIFNGLLQPPRVEQKFEPQRIDKIHCNYFIYCAFGTNEKRRHKNFKFFLHAITRPLKLHPMPSTILGS